MIFAMKTPADTLPNDLNALKEIILKMGAQLAQQETLITTLRHQLETLKRARFGRASEQLDKQIHQLELQLEELETEVAALASSQPEPAVIPKKPRRRINLPEHLPRDERRLESACHCPDCQSELTHIGDDVSEILDVVPLTVRVIRVVRPKFSCSACSKLVQAPAPQRVIPKGLASANLLTQVMIDKYLDHQPLYRQAERMEREGVDRLNSQVLAVVH